MNAHFILLGSFLLFSATCFVSQVGGSTNLQTQIVGLSQNNSQVNNVQVWELQEQDFTVLFNLIYAKLAPYWSSNLSGLASIVNASKAEAIATNIKYAKAADVDIQNLYASLFDTTSQAQTCCGWSYNSNN